MTPPLIHPVTLRPLGANVGAITGAVGRTTANPGEPREYG